MYKEVSGWLAKLGMPVSGLYLRLRLESHPDYPSLTSVQDTLEELGIEANAYQSTKESLLEYGKPFLLHLNIGEGMICYFPNLAAAQKTIKNFDDKWSGVVMLAEPAVKYGNADHDKLLMQEKQNKIFKVSFLLVFLVFLSTVAINSISWAGLLFITNLAGLYFSWLITQKELGLSNSVSDKICSMTKHSRCESVFFSNGAKLSGWLTWGDVGMIWFSASIMYLMVRMLTPQYTSGQFYYLLSAAGALFPLYSVYYQWKVVKQWCVLCLAVVAILLLNGLTGILLLQWSIISGLSILKASLIFAGIAGLCLSGWQMLKHIYSKSLTGTENTIKGMRLKRNPDIFNALLYQEKIYPENLPQPDETIRFGNPKASFQIVIACSPYCRPCANAHKMLGELYERFPENISISVRFVINNYSNSGNVDAVRMILEAVKENPYRAMKDWYSSYNLNHYIQNQCQTDTNVDDALKKFVIWSKKAEIKFTPKMFVNGKKIPELYNWVEFLSYLKYIIIK